MTTGRINQIAIIEQRRHDCTVAWGKGDSALCRTDPYDPCVNEKRPATDTELAAY
jgi:hypothetical protein